MGNRLPLLRRKPWLVAAALALYWLMAVSVSPRMGVTADEVVHVTGGYAYWKFNDYRMHPENGTLPMRLAGLPWVLADARHPSLEDPTWLDSKVNLWGAKLFFESGNNVERLLWYSRMMVALSGAGVVWLTWLWARRLFGPAAGWIALGLGVFSPTMLAHGGLATSDMTMTACVLGALSAVWRLLHRATWGRLALAAALCGLAFLSKMSGVIIVPLIGALLLLRWLRRAPLVLAFGSSVRWLRKRGQIAVATFALMLAAAAGSLVVLWAGYGFRYEGFNRAVSAGNDYYFSWDVLLEETPLPWSEQGTLFKFVPPIRPPRPTNLTRLVGGLRDYRLLPEAYLWGFAHTYKFSHYRPGFFMGEYRGTGWKHFFPTAFVLKTTLPALALILTGALTLGWMLRHPTGALRVKPWLYRCAPLLVFFTVYWAMAINMTLNIGHRHILPTYPVFFVFASATALWLAGGTRRIAAFAVTAMLALHALDSAQARPFYLSYFQPLVRQAALGAHYFVDSSLDWGQGLPDLAAWLERKKRAGDASPVHLTYFGADSPRARGFDVVRFGDELSDSGQRYFPAQVRGGWYVISATYYRRVYMPTRGAWRPELEEHYIKLLDRMRQEGSRLPPEQLTTLAQDIELLQFARLCHFLRKHEPLEVIGGSLLVFRLSDAEVAAALYGRLTEN